MLCLGIESSCDDSSLALVRDGRLLGQAESSQARLHALFGGVVPELASREHAKYLGPLCDSLFAETGVSSADVDVVAVARGPGLLGSLLVGMAFAKAFALGCGAHLIGVNHLHAHILAAGIEQDLPLPAVALLVSGGHTHLYYVEGPRAFTPLGRTLDDAAGEAFDKAGKLLGLPYPAGAHVDVLAERGRADKRLFPRPYLDNDTLDFSFSGLKTAMATYLAGRPYLRATFNARGGAPVPPEGAEGQALMDVCASYRLAIVETLAAKTRKALERCPQARTLVLAGGVAANSLLRRHMAALAEEHGKMFCTPSPALCTDNGAMIAHAGFLLANSGFGHNLTVEAIPRGRRIPDDMRVYSSALLPEFSQP